MAPKERKKILYIITKSNWGGAQRYVYDLATSLPADKYVAVVACGGNGPLVEKLEAQGIRTATLRSFQRDIHVFKEIRAFFELLALYRKEKPDVVHLNSSKAGGLGAVAARFAGTPRIVFTSHGLAYDEDRPSWQRSLMRFFTWLTVCFTDATILITRDTYKRARKMPLVQRKLHLIHNGMVAPSLEAREQARACLEKHSSHEHVSRDIPWVGTISELTRNKGVRFAIEASAIAKERGVRFTFVVIGDGEERTMLEQLVHERGLEDVVHFLGFVPHAHEYLKALDVFTLTSVKEGLPYVLMEAGYASLPVVATRVGGVPDIITHEKTGILTEAGNTALIADALERLLEDEKLRERYGSALREHVTAHFSREEMIRKTNMLYH